MHVVWDWNGTILDDNDAVLAGVNDVCAAYGRDPVDLETWRGFYRRPLLECYQDLLGRALTTDDWSAIDRLYHDRYRTLLSTVRLAPGVPDELHRWRDSGGRQSLLSMWFHDELVPLVTAYGLTGLFTRVDGLRDRNIGAGKARHLVEHLTAQDLDPADVLLIGDVVDDADAAAAVGARCVLVTTGVATAAALRASGVPVVDSVADALAAARR